MVAIKKCIQPALAMCRYYKKVLRFNPLTTSRGPIGQVWGANVGRFYRMGTKLSYGANALYSFFLFFLRCYRFAGTIRGWKADRWLRRLLFCFCPSRFLLPYKLFLRGRLCFFLLFHGSPGALIPPPAIQSRQPGARAHNAQQPICNVCRRRRD